MGAQCCKESGAGDIAQEEAFDITVSAETARQKMVSGDATGLTKETPRKETPRKETPAKETPPATIQKSATPESLGQSSVASNITEADGPEAHGAYLMYSPLKNGSLVLKWSRNKVPNCVAFGMIPEGFKVPLFKYKTTTELARNLSQNSSEILKGLLSFLRNIRLFQCKVFFFGTPSNLAARMPNISLVFHTADNKLLVSTAEKGVELSSVDAVAALIPNQGAADELAHMETQTVAMLGWQNYFRRPQFPCETMNWVVLR